MDPFTAIGLAGTIVTFVDVGFKVVGKARAIRSSVTGATADNESLASMSLRLNATLSGLESKVPSGHLSQQEIALNELAKECRATSDELLMLLEELKARKPGSKRSSMFAALRDLRKKDERLALEKTLGRYRQELDLVLSSMMRFEFIERLNELVKYGQSSQDELASLNKNVHALRQGLDTKILCSEAVVNIDEVVKLSAEATSRVRECRILDALRFESMNDRIDDIADPHEKTFDWIFDDTSASESNPVISHSSLSDSGPHEVGEEITPEMLNARQCFIEWLEHGDGIFHIAGKPGSGKSTLMKYFCRNNSMKQHLQTWVGRKTVVFGRFFFWRLGTTHQKSLKGLLRGLLYSVISENRDLIPVAFPKQWIATLTHSTIFFDSFDEIREAFYELIGCDKIYADHNFVFLIDGLDEFEGDHRYLVRLLLQWTQARPDAVKICVASREWVIFQEAFKDSPRMHLHELTLPDISKLVRDKLNDNAHFMRMTNKHDRRSFQEHIARKAEGVFLWVKLILILIEDGFLSGDGMKRVTSKIESLPTELEKLFEYLFNSIHPTEQEEAFAILTMAQQCPRGWPLIRYSFIEDYTDNPAFALKGRFEVLTPLEIDYRLKQTRQRIYGKCKGLLEICPGPRDGNQRLKDDRTFEHGVKFTHWSVVEFLRRDSIKEEMATKLLAFNAYDCMCQTFLAHLKYVAKDEAYLYGHDLIAQPYKYRDTPLGLLPFPSLDWDLFEITKKFSRLDKAADNSIYCELMDDVIQEVKKQLRNAVGTTVIPSIIWHYNRDLFWGSYGVEVSIAEHVMHIAALCGNSDYCIHAHRKHDIQASNDLVSVASWVLCPDNTPQGRPPNVHLGLLKILDFVFQQGLSPNDAYALQTTENIKGVSWWHFFLSELISHTVSDLRGISISTFALFILNGGDPRFWITFGKQSNDGEYIAVRCLHGEDKKVMNLTGWARDIPAAHMSAELKAFLRSNGPEVSLRSVVASWYPQFSEPLQQAIDWMLERGGRISADQQKELEDRFGPSIRPLITLEAMEAADKATSNRRSGSVLPYLRTGYYKPSLFPSNVW